MSYIRQATEQDIPQLQMMQREGWEHDYVGYIPEHYAALALQRYGTAEAIAKDITHDRYYFVLTDSEALTEGKVLTKGEELLGCIAADHSSETEAELYWIHVARHHRGKGVGRNLLEYVLAKLEPTIQTLYVTTFQNYTPTLAFYKAVGFQEYEKKINIYDGVAVNEVRLKLRIHQREER
jgi:ribosomal protein S18 acetylase RimI-like enzyme